MSPFLRWGLFSIIAVGALVLAYNASKDMAAKRTRQAAATPATQAAQPMAASADCELEFVVAQRALEARATRDPLDRVLRMREIAFEEDVPRRERLASVARRWFAYERELDPAGFRHVVMTECAAVSKP